MTLENSIKQFYETLRPNFNMTILHSIYKKETGNEVSYQYFAEISKKYSSVRTVRTGGVEIRIFQLAQVISDRAYYNINVFNTISIDEKPFILKNYMIRSCRTSKNFKGSIYKSLYFGYKMKPVYLLAAVSCYGVICYKLYDSPVTNEDFCSFLVHLVVLVRVFQVPLLPHRL